MRTKAAVARIMLLAACATSLQLSGLNGTAFGYEASKPRYASTIYGEAYAIDGDTIKLDGQVKVRLSGVAAPERTERGGTEATTFMKHLVNGKKVRCELDGTRSHDRVVGICFLNDQDIGEAVIAAGLARDCPRFSGGKYAKVERSKASSLPLPRYCENR